MESNERPTTQEIEFLTLSFNRFYDIFEEVMSDDFMQKNDFYRFSRIKDAFAVYAELLYYDPIKKYIELLKETRPPSETEIGNDLFNFIRNVITHYPFFDRWDDIWISNSLANWYKEGQSIDRFLEKYKGHQTIKYRFWEASKKRMTFVIINFPGTYNKGTRVFLNYYLTENEGIKFSLLLMKQIIDSQVEQIKK